MSRFPVINSDSNTWGAVLNDFLAVTHNADGTLKSFINVKDSKWGAMGDGVTDDTLAIQAAINSITRGVICLPFGNYIISSSIIIDKPYITLLAWGEIGTTLITIAGSSDPAWAIIIGNTQQSNNCVIQGISFQGKNSTTSTGGAVLVRGAECDIMNCCITQFGGSGLKLDAVSGASDQCYFENITLQSNGMNAGTPGDNLVITGNTGDCEYHRIISFGNVAKNTTRHGFNCLGYQQKFVDCHAYFCSGDGFNQQGGANTQIVGGEWETNAGNGINIQNTSNIIIDDVSCFANTAKDIVLVSTPKFVVHAAQCISATFDKNMGIFSTDKGIVSDSVFIDANSTNLQISGCTRINVHDCYFESSVDAIQVDSTYHDIHDNIVSLGTIREQSGANYNQIHNNTLYPGAGSIVMVGTNTRADGNNGFNPIGSVTPPSIPASGTAIQNVKGFDCMVSIIAGTVTSIAIGNTSGTTVNTGITSNASGVTILLKAGQWIKLTYSVVPTSWTWFGE